MADARTDVIDGGPRGIARAAAALREGLPVAFPTETVYGLGADATNDRAVAAIFAIKRRPRFNPLIVHLSDWREAEAHAVLDERAHLLIETFGPGPLTLVLPRRPDTPISLLVSAGLETLALRVPGHPIAHALLQAAARPIAAPSANPSGLVSPTDARHVLDGLAGSVPLVIAGGRCPIGLESTVLDLTGPAASLLRPGAVTREALEAVLGPLGPADDDPTRPRSPGQLARHYAPGVPVRLNVKAPAPGEALLTFGPDLRAGEHVRNLSESGDLTEAAANLFAMLRALDRPDVTAIAVAPVPEVGLGVAINDRLQRAAAAHRPDDAGS